MGFHFSVTVLTGKYPEVETYADLSPADESVGEIVVVSTTTGVTFVNRKRAGLYRSDGITWGRLGTIEDVDIVAIVQTGVKLNELQNPNGSVEFSKQQTLQLAVENRTSDPGTPADGQIWLRMDL